MRIRHYTPMHIHGNIDHADVQEIRKEISRGLVWDVDVGSVDLDETRKWWKEWLYLYPNMLSLYPVGANIDVPELADVRDKVREAHVNAYLKALDPKLRLDTLITLFNQIRVEMNDYLQPAYDVAIACIAERLHQDLGEDDSLRHLLKALENKMMG